MKHSLVRILPLAALLLATACSPRQQTIIIVSTNDIHGSIDNFPKLATLVGKLRAENPGRVLLTDAGDRWTGNPYVDMYPHKYQPVITLMDSLHYDIGTYGNHEFDSGLDTLALRTSELNFPIVCANFDSQGTKLPQPAPYLITNVAGVKIAFLGLLTTDRAGYPDGFVENFGNIKFFNPLTTAQKYASLRDSADIFIALTHIGIEQDSLLALQMPSTDVILGGHSHTLVKPGKRIGNVLVAQAGSRLKYANITTISMQGKKITGIENRLVMLDTIAADPRIAAMVANFKNSPALQESVGKISAPMGKLGIMNMAADVVRAQAGADVALYNRGGVRIDTLASTDIKTLDIFSMEPFGNTIVKVLMSKDQIKEMIIRKFNSAGGESHSRDLWPSGFTYQIVTNGKDAVDVVLNIKAKPSPSGKYVVAMSNYVNQTYDFSLAGMGEPVDVSISQAFINYFKKNSPVATDYTVRATIVQRSK